MENYRVIALIGESGCGKDTIMRSVVDAMPSESINEIISCTTRPIREGEVEGVNYYYLTPKKFEYLIETNQMLEYTCFNNWYYGTSLTNLSREIINIGVFNPAGIYALKNNPQVDLTIYRIKTSNKIRLMRQLEREKSPDVDEIIRRYNTDKEDFQNLEKLSPYVELKNNGVLDFSASVQTIVGSLRGPNK